MTSSKKVKRIKAWAIVDGKGEPWTFRGQAAVCFLQDQAVDLKRTIEAINDYNCTIVPCTITLPAPTKR